jgi:serine phosphatase RsbU (regulator of sigma subunit)/CheY-like chemotaxis protein
MNRAVEPTRILVVDDRPENLVALQAVLDPLGETVVPARSGDEALRELLRNEYALILLDVQMPGLDGFATATMIKQHPRTANTPIIFLTAFDERLDHAVAGYSSGAVDYLAKPFDAAILQAKVRVFLQLHRQRALLERQRLELEAHNEELRESRHALAEAQRDGRLANWEVDGRTGRVTGSAEFRRIVGVAPVDPLPPAPALFSRLHFPDSGATGWMQLLATPGRDLHGRLVRADGGVRHVVVNVERMRDGTESDRYIGTLQDVTEQREATAALASTQRALEREREVVEHLQRAVTPSEPQPIGGLDIAHRSRPAEPFLIGGDWYDVVPLPDGRAIFTIGDVAGHGIGAAATMSQLHAAIRVVVLDETDPAAILRQVNRYVFHALQAVFSTMMVVCLDPLSGACAVASAGHLPPVRCIEEGGGQVEWGATGPPLGADPDATYDEATFELPSGSALVLYTDGLVERRGESLDDGVARLERQLADPFTSSDELADRLIVRMCADTVRRDDVALLVVRRPAEVWAGSR